MFLFKKCMNEEAAKSFWKWFEEQEKWIINCIAAHNSDFIWAIDGRLALRKSNTFVSER